MNHRLHTPARGFTMIELVVVIALLSIVSGLVLPRLVNTGARQAQIEAFMARTLLSAAAQRDALSVQAMALTFDGETHELSLLVQSSNGEPDAKPVWSPAALVAPARFETGKVKSVAIDGQPMSAPSWKIEFSASQPRPSISLLVIYDGSALAGVSAWQVDLFSDSTAASIAALASPEDWRPGTSSSSVDLDMQGRRSTPW